MIYCGIDPGANGALCILHENGDVQLVPFDKEAYRKALVAFDSSKAVALVERVHAFSGQGVTSMFNFGANYGWICGLLDGVGIPFDTIDPRSWKKVYGITSDKATSIAMAHKVFPSINLYRTKRCRSEHDGLAEAALIAEVCRRKDTTGL